jgi:O-antigen ligase
MPSSPRHERSRFSGETLVLFGALCLAAYLWTAFERSGPLVPKWLFAAGLLLLAAVPLVSPLRGAVAVFFLVPFFGNFPGGRWMEVLNIPLSAGIVGLLVHARRRKLPPPAERLWAAALLYVASAALAFIPSLEGVAVRFAQINSLPEAVVETLSARETDPLYSLSSLLLLVLAAAWAYALAWASPGRAFAKNALRAVAASFFLVMALGALNLHGRIDLQSAYLKRIDERSLSFEGFQSIFWNPGWFSWYFVMAFGLVMGLLWLESRPVRWLLGAGLGVSYVYSFGNPQRGGFLALHAELGVAVLCLLASSVSKRRNLVWAATVLCVAVVLAVIALRVVPKHEGRGTAWARLTSGLETDSVRKNLAATAARMWRDFPLFGIGEGSFAWRYGEYVRVGSDLSTDAGSGDAHSTWLQLLATRGILGLAAFLGLLLTLGRRVVRAVRGAGPERGIGLGLGFSLIAFLTYSFVQYMFYLQGIQALFWGIAALAAIVSPEFREERPLPRVARWALAAAGLGALILQLGLSRVQLARGAARVRLEPRGFYPVEMWGAEGPMRWSSRNGTLCLYPSARTLSLRMLTADPDASNRPIAVSIRVNGKILDRFELKDVVVRSFDLQQSELVRPPEGERPFGQCVKGPRSVHLSVEVSRTWSPFSRGVSGDTRHLGVAVFEPKFSSGAAASHTGTSGTPHWRE